MKFAGRFHQRWCFVGLLMTVLVYCAIYISTHAVFDADIDLSPPRAVHGPVYPWDKHYHGNDAEDFHDDKHDSRQKDKDDHKEPQGANKEEKLQVKEEVKKEEKKEEKKKEAPKKQEPKKQESKKQEPQKQELKKQEPQKQESKKQESKKQEPQKQESKKQEPKNEDPPKKDSFMEEQEKIQNERKKILEDVCAANPQLSKGNINVDTQRHLLVNEKHKLLYCFIPKVGCSNWKRVLMILGGKSNKNIVDITSDEAHYRHGMKRLQAYKKDQQDEILKTYTTFMYARNPFLRILSAYKNKYGDVVMYRKETYFHQFAKKMIKKYRENPSKRALDTGENATWTEFVMYLTDPVKNYFDDHWEEMYKLCSPCKIMYHYLGQLETIGSDADYMLRKLNLNDAVSFPSRKTSHPTNSTESFNKAFTGLTLEQLKRLWEIYKLDFQLFGYPRPDFLPGSIS